MINILTKTTGEFVFLDDDYDKVTFTNYNDIPENFSFRHVVKFMPDIPPPPHTPAQHVEINEWNERFRKLMEQENERCYNEL